MTTGSPSFLPWLGVFETLRVERGRGLFIEEHWASLQRSAQVLGLTVSADLRLRAQALPQEEGRWRWIVAADGTRDFFTPEKASTEKIYALGLSAQRVGSENWDALHKTVSHLTHWQARQAARAVGLDEGVLLNEHGELASGAMSNLFWIQEGQIRTPATEAGCRAGVIRQWVLEQAEVETGSYPLTALDLADEVFVTNSMIGIMPVNRFEDRRYPIGPVTGELARKYRAVVAAA